MACDNVTVSRGGAGEDGPSALFEIAEKSPKGGAGFFSSPEIGIRTFVRRVGGGRWRFY